METESKRATYGGKEISYTCPVIQGRGEISEALNYVEQTLDDLPAQGKRGDSDPAISLANFVLDAVAKRKATLEHTDPLKAAEKAIAALKKRIKSGVAAPLEKQEYAKALTEYATLLRDSL
jgi:hypothetical protein